MSRHCNCALRPSRSTDLPQHHLHKARTPATIRLLQVQVRPQTSSTASRSTCCRYSSRKTLIWSTSFRGIGNLIYQTGRANRANGNYVPSHFYSCSAGNAGLAAATASKQMGQQACVVVPYTTSILMQEMISEAGGKVIVHGSCIAESDELVRTLVASDPLGVYVSPYNHEDIWAGTSTISFLASVHQLISTTNRQLHPD